jgi:hypothetical protein
VSHLNANFAQWRTPESRAFVDYAKAKTVRDASHAIYHSNRVISNVPLDLPNRASFLGELASSAN